MARHARPRTHRKTRNSAIAVVTAGAAALTVSAMRGPSHDAHTATAASGTTARTASYTGSQPANAAVANLARQSTLALQRAHDQASRRQEEARHRQEQSRKKAAPQPVRHRTTATTTTHKPAPAPAPHPSATAQPAATAAPAPAATPTATPTATAATTYANNLDGWIKQALSVMAQHNIPGTYDGIYRNIMRESSGDPNAVNNWDSNAAAGTPSKGLLQVIQPTFDTYHVAGTSNDIMDPVANIVAACNYAAAMYGSIDNVNGPY
ncbi:transglycosylase SLT domain-containing protein [Actinacidiphila rubida]|uniref:Transglycosylase SLT domain-containing protein n=1 Tax=Actinacidiphila rubida TaxID=310780 RepID=A0A1H8S2C5_9ACTN|nr:transglycosylase SLT domain-containing protein [Actinacidiphila rubida]SEO72323.1 Transglycosylase SLT domain-containing protein [Actinacidiphila rubida]